MTQEAPEFVNMLESALLTLIEAIESGRVGEPFTGDHHSGYCFAIFKGNKETCDNVRKYLDMLRTLEKARGLE